MNKLMDLFGILNANLLVSTNVFLGNIPFLGKYLHISTNIPILLASSIILLLLIAVFYLYSKVPSTSFLKRQKALENEVEQKNVELTEMFERLTDSFIAIDKDFKYTYLNEKACKLIRMQPSEVIGKNVWDIFPDLVGTQTYDAFHAAMAEQRHISYVDYYAPFDVWTENHVYPSTNGFTVFIRDITAKKKTDLQLEQNELKYRTLIEQAGDGILISNQQGFYLDANTAISSITGYTKEELLTMHGRDLLFKQDLEETPLVIDRLRTEGKTITERRIKRKDGSSVPVEISAQVLPDGNFMGIIRDIRQRKENEAEIAKEQLLSASVINSLPGIFYLYDSNGRFLKWNKNFEVVSGYTHEEISSMHPLNFFDEDEKQLLTERIGRVFIDGKAEVEAHFLTKSKKKIHYFFNGWQLEYEGQQCLIGVGIDITAQKINEQLIIKEKELSDSIINSLPGIFYLRSLDGKFIRWNKQFETITGYHAAEVENLSISQLFEQDQEEANRKTQVMGTQGHLEAEITIKTKSGQHIPYYFTGRLIEYEGQLCSIGVGMDIEDRKKAEEELQQSERKYRLLFDNNPLPMWMIDVDTLAIIDANEASVEHYGYSKEEFMKMTIRDFRPPEDVHKMEEAVKRQNASIRKTGTWTHIKKDGTEIKVEITSHDINYQQQRTRLILANDITDKVKAEEKLYKVNDELRELYTTQQNIREEERKHIAREIHDELGQLITGLKMDISWLKKKIIVKQPELTDKLNETIGLLDESVKTIRKISSELRPGILDDLGIIDALKWLAKDFERRTSIMCIVNSPEGEIKCSDDVKVVVFRIFQETLTNVMRHAQATEVIAELSRDSNALTMQIADNGKGFDVAVKTKTLGLLGMKERIINIKGELYISSAVGRGTTVTIIIPVKD